MTVKILQLTNMFFENCLTFVIALLPGFLTSKIPILLTDRWGRKAVEEVAVEVVEEVEEVQRFSMDSSP